jgi:hypothetical protein
MWETFGLITKAQPDLKREQSVVEIVFTGDNIKAGFRKSGLWPLNQEKVLEGLKDSAKALNIPHSSPVNSDEVKEMLSVKNLQLFQSGEVDFAAADSFVDVISDVSGQPVFASTLKALERQGATDRVLRPALSKYKRAVSMVEEPQPPGEGATREQYMDYCKRSCAFTEAVTAAAVRYTCVQDFVAKNGTLPGKRKRVHTPPVRVQAGCSVEEEVQEAAAEEAAAEEEVESEDGVEDENWEEKEVRGRGGMSAKVFRSVLQVEGTTSGRGRRRIAKRRHPGE